MLYSKFLVIKGLKQKQDYFVSFYFNHWKHLYIWMQVINLQTQEHDKVFLLQAIISNDVVLCVFLSFVISKIKS